MKGQKNHFELYKIDGVGVDLSRFKPVKDEAEKVALREKYGFNRGDFILLYTAEFIPRKNHAFLLRAVPELRAQIPNLRLLLPGKGVLLKEMKILAVNLEIDDIVWFAGYRKDIADLCRISDVHVAVSRQEGQGLNNVEAMSSGLPLVVSDIRGHRDVVKNGRNGFLFAPDSQSDMVASILRLYQDSALRSAIGKNNTADSKKYSVDTALDKMSEIYDSCIRSENLDGGG